MAKLPFPISFKRLKSPMMIVGSAGGGSRRSEGRSMIADLSEQPVGSGVRVVLWMSLQAAVGNCLYRRSCGYRVAVIWLYICLVSPILYAVKVPLAGREFDAESAELGRKPL
jgi:hypothetical protein